MFSYDPSYETPERVSCEDERKQDRMPLQVSDLDTPFDYKATPELEAAAYISGIYEQIRCKDVKAFLRRKREDSREYSDHMEENVDQEDKLKSYANLQKRENRKVSNTAGEDCGTMRDVEMPPSVYHGSLFESTGAQKRWSDVSLRHGLEKLKPTTPLDEDGISASSKLHSVERSSAKSSREVRHSDENSYTWSRYNQNEAHYGHAFSGNAFDSSFGFSNRTRRKAVSQQTFQFPETRVDVPCQSFLKSSAQPSAATEHGSGIDTEAMKGNSILQAHRNMKSNRIWQSINHANATARPAAAVEGAFVPEHLPHLLGMELQPQAAVTSHPPSIAPLTPSTPFYGNPLVHPTSIESNNAISTPAYNDTHSDKDVAALLLCMDWNDNPSKECVEANGGEKNSLNIINEDYDNLDNRKQDPVFKDANNRLASFEGKHEMLQRTEAAEFGLMPKMKSKQRKAAICFTRQKVGPQHLKNASSHSESRSKSVYSKRGSNAKCSINMKRPNVTLDENTVHPGLLLSDHDDGSSPGWWRSGETFESNATIDRNQKIGSDEFAQFPRIKDKTMNEFSVCEQENVNKAQEKVHSKMKDSPTNKEWHRLNALLRQNGFSAILFEVDKDGKEPHSIDMGQLMDVFFNVLKEFEKRTETCLSGKMGKNGYCNSNLLSDQAWQNCESEKEASNFRKLEKTNEKLQNDLKEAEQAKYEARSKSIRIGKELNENLYRVRTLESNVKKKEKELDKVKLQLEKINEAADHQKQRVGQILQKYKGKTSRDAQLADVIHSYEMRLGHMEKENQELRKMFKDEGSKTEKLTKELFKERSISKCYYNSIVKSKNNDWTDKEGRDFESPVKPSTLMSVDASNMSKKLKELLSDLEVQKSKRFEVEKTYRVEAAACSQDLKLLSEENDKLKALLERKQHEIDALSLYYKRLSRHSTVEACESIVGKATKDFDGNCSIVSHKEIVQGIRRILNVPDGEDFADTAKRLEAKINSLQAYQNFTDDVFDRMENPTGEHLQSEALSSIDKWKAEAEAYNSLREQLLQLLGLQVGVTEQFSETGEAFTKNYGTPGAISDEALLTRLSSALNQLDKANAGSDKSSDLELQQQIISYFMQEFGVKQMEKCIGKINLVKKELLLYSNWIESVTAMLGIPCGTKLNQVFAKIIATLQIANQMSSSDARGTCVSCHRIDDGGASHPQKGSEDREMVELIAQRIGVDDISSIPERLEKLICCLDNPNSERKIIKTLKQLLHTDDIEVLLPRLHKMFHSLKGNYITDT